MGYTTQNGNVNQNIMKTPPALPKISQVYEPLLHQGYVTSRWPSHQLPLSFYPDFSEKNQSQLSFPQVLWRDPKFQGQQRVLPPGFTMGFTGPPNPTKRKGQWDIFEFLTCRRFAVQHAVHVGHERLFVLWRFGWLWWCQVWVMLRRPRFCRWPAYLNRGAQDTLQSYTWGITQLEQPPRNTFWPCMGVEVEQSFVNSWFLKERLVWLYRVFLAFVEDGFDMLFDSAFSGCLRQSFLEHFDLLIPKVCIANDMSRWLRPITRTARMKANQRIWICIIPHVPFCQLVLVNIWVFLNFYSAIIVSLIDSAFSGCRIETWKQFVFLGCSCILVGRYPHSVASNDSFSGCWNHLRVFAT